MKQALGKVRNSKLLILLKDDEISFRSEEVGEDHIQLGK